MKKIFAKFSIVSLALLTTGSVFAADAGLGVRIGVGFGYATNILNRSTQHAVYGGLAGGGGAAKFIADKQTRNACSLNAAQAAITDSTCKAEATGSGTASNGIDLNFKVEYDLAPLIGLPLFLRSGFNLALGFRNQYDIKVEETLTTVVAAFSVGDVYTNQLTYTSSSSQWEIPILLGLDLIRTDKSAVYFAVGLNITRGTFEHQITAVDTGVGGSVITASTALNKAYIPVNNEITGSGLGIMYVLGGRTEIATNLSLFGEVRFLEASAANAVIEGTPQEANQQYASDHPLIAALPTSTQTLLSISGGIPGVIQYSEITAGTSTKTPAHTVLNLSYTRWTFGVNYTL